MDLILIPKNLNPLLNRLLLLLLRPSLGTSEDHLRNQAPFKRDIPFLGYGLVNERVVVLQVCAEAERLESGPQEILVHSIRVLSPRLEMLLVDSELLREGLDMRGVFVEEDLFEPSSVYSLIQQRLFPEKQGIPSQLHPSSPAT